MKKYLFYILILCLGLVNAQNEDVFEKANALYNQEKYSEAIFEYDQILKSGYHSASLYYNKANAYYKLNKIAESIYNYEKALILDPDNDDAKTNLAFANNMRIDKIDTIPTTGLLKLFNGFINMLSFDAWAILAVITMLFFVLLFLLYINAFSAKRKQMLFAGAFLLLFISLMSVFFAYKQEANSKSTVFAIVFAKESKENSDPKLSGDEVFILHEGTKVKVLDTFNDWSKVKLTNGSIGWLVSKDIKAL